MRKGRGAKVLGGNRPELKKTLREPPFAIDIFKNELLKHKEELQKTGLFFSFTTDPLLPETERLTRQAVGICQRNGVPVKILSKCAEGINGFIDFAEASEGWDLSRIAIGSTLTGCDELEPNASPNAARVNVLARAKRHGFRTFASIEPVVDFGKAFAIIKLAYPFVDLFKIGLLSGGKFKQRDVFLFITEVHTLFMEKNPTARIYWKDGILKAAEMEREILPNGAFRLITICLTKTTTKMQFNNKDYNPAQHDRWRALTVKTRMQPSW